ncbi:TIR domain-containing protein [Variovorax sp. dw_954]|uniref:TIR domain-containing protein n=1 Tax=Variovorax sp. dw_954 TaxID=2720078 RepID=UPI001BD4F567|nr:TIR domain-containing protein [Variovorax sp. dw_954]
MTTANKNAEPLNVALIVDVDNIWIGASGTVSQRASPVQMARTLQDFAKGIGTVNVARAYGTTYHKKPNKVMQSFASESFEAITVANTGGKSSIDLKISLDTQELLFTSPSVGVYILASGDSDISVLAEAIGRKGAVLILVAPRLVTSTTLIARADFFVSLEDCLSGARLEAALVAAGRNAKRPTAPPPLPIARRSLKVFLCYSRKDEEKVRELYGRLKGEQGIQPWLDKEDLLGGQNWAFEIERAVEGSHAVIVCLSKHAIDRAGFVHKEIKIALDAADYRPEGTAFIIPVRLEMCETPKRLALFHSVDLFEAGGHALLLRSLQRRADAIQ